MGCNQGLMLYEHGVLRRTFGLKREDMTGGWRKYTEELHNLRPLYIIGIIESWNVS